VQAGKRKLKEGRGGKTEWETVYQKRKRPNTDLLKKEIKGGGRVGHGGGNENLGMS